MVDNPIEDSGCHDLVSQDCTPVLEVSVRGKNSGLGLIAMADNFKEIIQGLRGQGTEPDFVEDEQVGGYGLLKDTAVRVVGTSLGQPLQQGVEMVEQDGISLGGGLQADGVC